MNQYYTEYVKILSYDEIKEMDEIIGVVCNKCNTSFSKIWYKRKFYFDGFVDYHILCDECIKDYKYFL